MILTCDCFFLISYYELALGHLKLCPSDNTTPLTSIYTTELKPIENPGIHESRSTLLAQATLSALERRLKVNISPY